MQHAGTYDPETGLRRVPSALTAYVGQPGFFRRDAHAKELKAEDVAIRTSATRGADGSVLIAG